LHDLGDDVKRADVMRHIPENLPEGRGRERCAIGGDPEEGQVACLQGGFSSPQKGSDVVVGGIVIQDVREETLVAAIIDRGEHTARSVIELIGSHIARKIRQGPVKDVRVHQGHSVFG